jgi:hypothetical protein
MVPRPTRTEVGCTEMQGCLFSAARRVGPGNFTPSLSQIPYVNLSIHTARAIA